MNTDFETTKSSSPLYLGIDLGTSGVRTAVVDVAGTIVATASVPMEPPVLFNNRPCQNAEIWWQATCQCLKTQSEQLNTVNRRMEEVDAISVDGTSGTLLLTDSNLNPLSSGFMYNSTNFNDEAEVIALYAPENSIARGAGSALARLLFLQKHHNAGNAKFALHQADWIAAKLMDVGGLSDETNALKTGYDVVNRTWPDWLPECGVNRDLLPTVKPVGEPFDTISRQTASQFGFHSKTQVIAGTTDSNAAFLASGASKIGEGVTSLGTTLAIKLLSRTPVADPSRGIYSHRIKDMWLPGGASNTGGGVLLKYFTADRIAELENEIDPSNPTGLDYYPLSQPGERFPISDSHWKPRLTPHPEDDATFFQGMLEGISEIERAGYAALEKLGAPGVEKIFTAGGGSKNKAWTQIRSSKMGVPIVDALASDAAVGTARIAAGLV